MRQSSPADVLRLVAAAAGAGSTLQLLDVREPWETALAEIRIDGATLLRIPMGELPARLAEVDPARPVVCICHHGVRSAQVVAFLERLHPGPVYNLAGGIDAWSCEIDPALPRY